MPLEDRLRESAREWLRRAKSNLALAKQPKPADAVWEDLCFEAQQAAEKGVKAVLVLRGIDFPKTHEIAQLLAFLENAGQAISDDLWRAAPVLTPYAVETRYPGPAEPVTEDEYHQAVILAEKVVHWAEDVISKGA